MQAIVENVEDYCARTNLGPLLKFKSPWPLNYRLESDITSELSPRRASYYQSLIGVLQWIVKLSRGDLVMEVSAIASIMALSREGHLGIVF